MRLCGCEIDPADVDRLVDLLHEGGSREAAAAIRWGSACGCSADSLEPDIQEAIVRVLRGAPVPAGLRRLRTALASFEGSGGEERGNMATTGVRLGAEVFADRHDNRLE